jgi:PEGA domain
MCLKFPAPPFVFVRPALDAHFGRSLLAVTILAAAIFAAGCGDDADEQVVKLESTPANATVKIDGTPVGHTPMSPLLGVDQDTLVSFEKPGFDTAQVTVHPVGHTLTPNPVTVQLRPDMMPGTPGDNPQAGLARSLAIVQAYVDMGRIGPDDQAYMKQRLTAFYLATPAPGNTTASPTPTPTSP